MNLMDDYHDLYLKTNVLLLTSVFKMFIKTYLDYYGLDPCHHFSSPRLRWDARLKMKKIELDLIHDLDIYLFIEKRMRGDISYITKGHSKIKNNKYMECYNSSKESKYILYFDANSLYGWAMGQHLPYSGFK